MALLPAYAVDGGTLPAEMLRFVAHTLSGGAQGVATPSDLRVAPLPTPGGGVTIAPGGALIPTRFTGATAQQTYVVSNDATETLNIPATDSSGGRTDYIILRVDDPNYTGQTPDDPLTALYCSFERVASIDNLPYPFIPLARVSLPASTGTVQASHITDLREVAQPRTKTEWRVLAIPSGQQAELTDTRAYPTGTTWPQAATDNWGPIQIPDWATRMKISMTWAGTIFPAGNVTGHVWVQVGLTVNPDKVITRATAFDSPGVSNASRFALIAADEVAIPDALRGTAQRFYPRGAVNSGTAYPRLSMSSAMLLQVEFMETAD